VNCAAKGDAANQIVSLERMIEWSEPLGLGDAEVATDLAAEVLVDLVVVLVVPQTVSGSLRENSNEHK